MSVNSAASSMDYAECIQAQSGNLTWAEQVEKGELQDPPSLSYVPLETVPLEPVDDLVYVPHGIDTNNTLSFISLESFVILYQVNWLANLQLWDGNFSPISLFGINEFLTSDVKNIVYFLFRIATFVKQWLLGNRITKNISQIVDFGFISWEFIITI